MVSKRRIASVVGARPNFIKLSPVNEVLKKHFDHQIIHTGQHYDFEMSEIFFKELKIPSPDINLDVGSGTIGYQVGEAIKKLEQQFLKHSYDLVIVYGDTNSTFAAAFAASRANIKVAHVEAGLRSFDTQMPEEINRLLTDNLSNILFAPTKTAVSNLFKESNRGKVFNSGDISVEITEGIRKKTSKRKVLEDYGITNEPYLLFTMHRAENTLSKKSILSIIKIFEDCKDFRIIFPIHPRTKKVMKEYGILEKINQNENVSITNPLGYLDFISLLQNAYKIVTDSGGIQKEAYLFSVPCITIRKNTEWIETVDEGWNVLVGSDTQRIVNHIKNWQPKKLVQRPIFGQGKTSELIRNEIRRYLE